MQTKRLVIRRFTTADQGDINEIIRDKMASPYAPYDEQFPTDDNSLTGILSYFASTDEFLALQLIDKPKIIGYIALNRVDQNTRNLGYCVHSAYQNMGYATEAVTEIISYATNQLKLAKLISGTAEENTPSVAILQKFGFTLTAKEKGSFVKDANGNSIVFTGCSFEKLL